MEIIKGYEGKKVKLFSYEEINKALKEGKDLEVFEIYKETNNLLHFQSDKCKAYKNLNLKHYGKLSSKLKEKVIEIVKEKGFDTENGTNRFNSFCLSIDDTNKREESINFEELLKEGFCNGRLLEKYRIVNKFSEIKDEDINEIIEKIRDLETEQLRALLEFIKDENIDFTEIRNIEVESEEYLRIDFFNREYVLLTDNEGERKAREYLEDDTEMWRMAVDGGHTESSFSEWVDEVLNIDGWAQTLNSYDGCSNYLFKNWEYMRTN